MKFRSVALASATLLALVPAGMSQAAPPSSEPTVLAGGLIGPLHLAVGPGHSVTVAESFAGKLTTVDRTGSTTSYVGAEGWDVAGVDYRGSTLYFVESVGAGPDPSPMVGSLKSIDAAGNVTTITDQIAQYEMDNNLDADVQYGLSPEVAAANPECVAELETVGFPAAYTGADAEVDSHAYGLAVRGNTAYVADAGANAVLAINLKTGSISTVAVLPPQTAEITTEAAEMLGVPSCAGLEYAFEAVPTDLEFGPDGMLYVGLLPGGPEDPSLGARGSVHRIDVASGHHELYVDGLMTPTGLAFDGDGNLYVASLFGEGIYQVEAGTKDVNLFLPAMMAVDVDVKGSTLYATTSALMPPGELISMPLR
ncbi:ScyD/ScyE family protein [Tessaracoccus sp. MC1756]|uniref:ScyD/ScyE family protein n=1 Tax=Tessaracoccus sp. MC1756 TaxID=2760311 RepID=UPI00160316E9|nr:ScyD/ScyE family protein [Tessaracoccus sp. MC1756]MBB1509677.1 ScyD/ScyE family protein [Tessaracoccus sp. MC1756]